MSLQSTMQQQDTFTHLSAEKAGGTTVITLYITCSSFLDDKMGPFTELRALVERLEKKIEVLDSSLMGGTGIPDVESIACEITMALHSHIQPETAAPVGDILEEAGINTTASLNRKLTQYYHQYYIFLIFPYSFD